MTCEDHAEASRLHLRCPVQGEPGRRALLLNLGLWLPLPAQAAFENALLEALSQIFCLFSCVCVFVCLSLKMKKCTEKERAILSFEAQALPGAY